MIKLMIAGCRASGLTRRRALDHMRDIHARMVVCPPPGAGAMPLDYVQNHVIDGAYPGDGAWAIERELITELWFESAAHLKTATTTPYYLGQLRPDEPRFVDDATVAKLMVRAEPLRDGARGRFKVFLFLRGTEDITWFGRLPRLGEAVRNVVLPSPHPAATFADVVLEGWFDRAEDALDAIGRLATASGPAYNFAVATEEYDSERLRAHHDCGE